METHTPVGSLSVVFTVFLVLLCLCRQLEVVLTALLKKPIRLHTKKDQYWLNLKHIQIHVHFQGQGINEVTDTSICITYA